MNKLFAVLFSFALLVIFAAPVNASISLSQAKKWCAQGKEDACKLAYGSNYGKPKPKYEPAWSEVAGCASSPGGQGRCERVASDCDHGVGSCSVYRDSRGVTWRVVFDLNSTVNNGIRKITRLSDGASVRFNEYNGQSHNDTTGTVALPRTREAGKEKHGPTREAGKERSEPPTQDASKIDPSELIKRGLGALPWGK